MEPSLIIGTYIITLKTLIVGLGNPILGDDGVGWRIAQELQIAGNLPSDADVICLAVGGISLMESLVGYKRAIIIDAIVTHKAPIGTIRRLKLEDLTDPSSGHLSSAHDTSLQNALRIGHDLGIQLPDEIVVLTIESQKVYDFSEDLTPAVSAAIPNAISNIMELLSGSNPSV